MKVLFNCHIPFSLAHGGAQIQIEETKAALEKQGVEVEMVRWWDDKQNGNIFHHFGRIPLNLLRTAKTAGMKVVFSDLLTETGSRPRHKLLLQKAGDRVLRRVLPRSTIESLRWDSYREADACLALTQWEAHLMKDLFQARPDAVRVVPNGVEEVFLNSTPQPRGKWLICTATVTQRKRVLETAEAAVQAQTPLWVVGKPYSESDPYGHRFTEFAKAHPELIRYEGPLSDRNLLAQAYRHARGFVLLSTMESLSLSALEAVASECPLLLSDQPWATWTFRQDAQYCNPFGSSAEIASALRRFYDAAPKLPVPPRPLSWAQVGQEIEQVYETVMGRR